MNAWHQKCSQNDNILWITTWTFNKTNTQSHFFQYVASFGHILQKPEKSCTFWDYKHMAVINFMPVELASCGQTFWYSVSLKSTVPTMVSVTADDLNLMQPCPHRMTAEAVWCMFICRMTLKLGYSIISEPHFPKMFRALSLAFSCCPFSCLKVVFGSPRRAGPER